MNSFGKIGGNGGPVEVDETFVGGRIANMHKSKKARMTMIKGQQLKGDHMNKTIVMGLLDRELRQVRAKVVPNVRRDTLQKSGSLPFWRQDSPTPRPFGNDFGHHHR